VFYCLISLARIRCNRNFSHWATVNAAVHYGLSDKSTCHRIPVYFGLSCTLITMKNNLKEFQDTKKLYRRIRESLVTMKVSFTDQDLVHHEIVIMIGAYDNSQKNSQYKFQRHGASSDFVKVTARLFIDTWQGPWQQIPIPAASKAKLTYVKQPLQCPCLHTSSNFHPIK